MQLGEKIKFLREKHDLTLEDVGNAVGVGKSTVRKWENGMIANMRRDKIASLAKALHTTPAYLMGWADEVSEKVSEDTEITAKNIFRIETKQFPLLGEIACGQPIFAYEDRESYVEAGTNIGADFCLKARGDSMVNARIQDGDIIFIRRQPMVENGQIAAVIIDDEATLKRVYYYPEELKMSLNAENPRYAPIIYVGEELNHVRVLGLAVAFQSNVL